MSKQNKKDLSEMRKTAWSVTMWLTDETGYTEETLDQFVQAMPNDWALEGQMELGSKSQNNFHYQLLLKTPFTRGTKIAKFFPKCHIEEARKFHALQNYVHKADTRVAEFKTVENRSPQWSVVCATFFKWVLREKTDNGFFGVADEERLKLWDEFIGLSIEEGMHVDIIGVNPQYRSCILRYWTNYLARARQTPPVDKIDRQTKMQESTIPLVAEGGVPLRSDSNFCLVTIQQDESRSVRSTDGPPLRDSSGASQTIRKGRVRAKIVSEHVT